LDAFVVSLNAEATRVPPAPMLRLFPSALLERVIVLLIVRVLLVDPPATEKPVPSEVKVTPLIEVFPLITAGKAEFAILPADEIVASLESVMAALAEMSALTINEEVRLPLESL
jgi:hypothetical protein